MTDILNVSFYKISFGDKTLAEIIASHEARINARKGGEE